MNVSKIVEVAIKKEIKTNIYREMATLNLTKTIMKTHPVLFARAVCSTEEEADNFILRMLHNKYTTIDDIDRDLNA